MDRIANPELLRSAVPDLRGGIPGTLWRGCDQPTRDWLADEYRRQLASDPDTAKAARQLAMQRLLARHAAVPARAPDTLHGQLSRMNTLLIELAGITAELARAMTDAPDATDDAPSAPLDKEHTP